MAFNANLDKYDDLYQRMCQDCTHVAECHRSCTECDEFLERLESEDDDG